MIRRAANLLAQALVGAGRSILDSVFPSACVSCGAAILAEHGRLCQRCNSDLADAQSPSACPRCARTASPLAIYENACGRCRKEHFWNVRGIARVGPYAPVLRRMILRMKYAGDSRCTALLGELLAASLARESWLDEVEVFVPVPMHRLRRWQRPIDHALELARATAAALARTRKSPGIRVRPTLVRRIRYSPSQTTVETAAARFDNLRGCFAVRRIADVSGRSVCVIDNVITSGATLHEISKALRKAGARRIHAAVIARANPPGDPQPRSAPNRDELDPPL